MRVFEDYEGREVVLLPYDERHIASRHPDLAALGTHDLVSETLASPDIVIYSRMAYHHFRMRHIPPHQGNYVKVVVAVQNGNRYVRTAHFTGRLAHGEVIWQQER